MASIGRRCHELRINDEGATWRIIYRVDPDAIIIAAVFSKKTSQTARHLISTCKRRLRDYDDV
jgi:phage-related protein